MHFAILQRWDGEDQETLCAQFQEERKDECFRTFSSLQKQAHKRKFPVTYRLIELPGDLVYEGKEEIDALKAKGVQNIILSGGKVYEGVSEFRQE